MKLLSIIITLVIIFFASAFCFLIGDSVQYFRIVRIMEAGAIIMAEVPMKFLILIIVLTILKSLIEHVRRRNYRIWFLTGVTFTVIMYLVYVFIRPYRVSAFILFVLSLQMILTYLYLLIYKDFNRNLNSK